MLLVVIYLRNLLLWLFVIQMVRGYSMEVLVTEMEYIYLMTVSVSVIIYLLSNHRTTLSTLVQ